MPLAEVQAVLERARRAEAAVGGQGLRPPLQRQPRRVRSAAARGDRLGREPRAEAVRSRVIARLRQAVPFLVGLVLFVAALEVLRIELRAVTWHELSADVWDTPPSQLIARRSRSPPSTTSSSPATTCSPSPTSARRCRALSIAAASFLAYAISNNVGFAMLSGASVRYRFYTRWGVTRRGAVADRVLLLGDVLARPVRARRAEPRDGAASRGQRPSGADADSPPSAGC